MHIESARRAESSFAISLLAAALVSLHPSSANADPPCSGEDSIHGYRIIDTESTDVAGGLRRTVTTVQSGDDPLDRFLVHRVALPVEPRALRGVILLLPPLASGFQNYEVGEDGDYANSFAAFFAARGYDVWGYSQRVQGLVAGSCESGAVDCTAMGGWGLQSIIDDVTFVRGWIRRAHPGAQVAIGGLSLGSIAAVAVIDAHPHDYDGAFLLEGTSYDADPTDRAINDGFCAYFDDLLAQGIFYDGQQVPGTKLVSALASIDPEGPSPLPGLPAGYTNHQAFVSLFSVPAISPITPRPNYFMVAGDPAADRFTFANDALLRANIAVFVDYVAVRTLRDVNCSLAGERTWNSHLGDYRGALFVKAGGHGFGPAMLDTVALMPRARPTVAFVAPFGHVDHYFAENHRDLTEGPMLAWLEDEAFRRH
jgi:hypothetical protein